MHEKPNPQGKGVVPVLQHLTGVNHAVTISPKNIDQISNELFTSLFILESDFSFKPIVGKSYWLYRKENRFRLSLISPQEWNGSAFGQFIGECVLHEDITWSLNLDEEAGMDQNLLEQIEVKRRKFQEELEKAEQVETVLPVFKESLSFYQRVLAYALSRSLSASMKLSGINGLSYNEIKAHLPFNE